MQQHRNRRVCPWRDCVYISNEVLAAEVEKFDEMDIVMHTEAKQCDTAPVINILEVLRNNLFIELDIITEQTSEDV